MKLKKSIVALLIMVLLSGVIGSNAFAAETDDDVTETVYAGFGEGQEQHVAVNDNVIVEGSNEAVYVKSNAPEGAEDKSASARINGSVSVTNQGQTTAVCTDAWEGDACAYITGDVSAKGNCVTKGIYAYGYGDQRKLGVVEVGGDVTAESLTYATGVDSEYGQVDVKGNVTAKTNNDGQIAYGIDSEDGGSITIGGNANATGASAVGIKVEADDDEKTTVKVNGNVSVTAQGSREYDAAVGVSVMNYAANILVDIGGNLTVNGQSGQAVGVDVSNSMTEGMYGRLGESDTSGETTVKIHGDLKTNGTGILAADKNGRRPTEYSGDAISYAPANLLVEGTVDAGDVGIMILPDMYGVLGESITPVEPEANLDLTVWKVKLNKNGNVAEWSTPMAFLSDGDSGMHEVVQPTTNAATNFEKSIKYIIKVEQPTKGGTIKAVDANGNAQATSMGYEVAHEGDKVVLKTNVAKGYKLVAAYNEDGVKQTLLKDANGDYYIVVPKGGGVYLKVELEKIKKAKKYNSGKKSNVNGDVTDAVQTGDHDHAIVWIMLMVLSIGSAAGIGVYRRRQWI